METLNNIQAGNKTQSLATESLLVLGASILLAASAQISVSLPFSVVPFSLQPHAVLLLAMTLGSRRAFAAVALYLLEGCMGMPVFAQGMSGLAHLLGPRGGYLLSYLPVTMLVGSLFDRGSIGFVRSAGALLLGSAMTLAFGASWLAMYVGAKAAWTVGFAPFVVTDLLKDAALLCMLPLTGKISRWLAN